VSKVSESIWLPVSLLVFLFCMLGLVVYADYTVPDAEPTSRCIDTKWRIFERGDDFSIAEDSSCAQ
jgi:hypothetical protein